MLAIMVKIDCSYLLQPPGHETKLSSLIMIERLLIITALSMLKTGKTRIPVAGCAERGRGPTGACDQQIFYRHTAKRRRIEDG